MLIVPIIQGIITSGIPPHHRTISTLEKHHTTNSSSLSTNMELPTKPLTLISGLPSPFARMPRIALALKRIPFTLVNENPWESTATTTRTHNPLQKLPVLVVPDAEGRKGKVIHDSTLILEYIVRRWEGVEPKLMPRVGERSEHFRTKEGGEDEVLETEMEVKQIVVLAQGCLDAIILARWELKREERKRSDVWLERQNRRVDGAIAAFSELVETRVKQHSQAKEDGIKEYHAPNSDTPKSSQNGITHGTAVEDIWLVGDEITLADIAVVVAVGWIDWWGIRPSWKSQYPMLAEWFMVIDARKEFAETRPQMFVTTEKVV
jgi:glutathione S-transferase